MSNANLTIKINAEDQASNKLKDLGDHADKAGKHLQEAGEKGEGFGSKLNELARGLGEVGLASYGLQSVGQAFEGLFAPSIESQNSIAQLNAVLKSTNEQAGVTAEMANNLADQFEKTTTFGDETVRTGEDLLLTFTNIGKDVFPAATETMLNMSSALGQDVKSSAIQLGKALNDPIKGITALQRVGVSFTAEQKELIHNMVKSGNVMGAQQVILDELQKEFGGAAVAAGNTFGGSLERLMHQIDNIQKAALEPLIEALTEILPHLVDAASAIAERLEPAFAEFGQQIKPVIEGIAQFGEIAVRVMSGDVSASFEEAFGPVGKLLDDFVAILQHAGDVVNQVVQGDFEGAFNSLATNVMPLLEKFTSDFADQVKEWATELVGWIEPSIGPMLDQLAALDQRFMQWIIDAVPPLVDKLADWAGAFIDWIGPQIDPMLHELGAFLIKMNEWILTTALPQIVTHLAEWGLRLVEWVAPRIVPLLAELGKLLLELLGWAAGAAVQIGNKIVTEWAPKFLEWVGANVVPKLGQVLHAILDSIGEWVTGTAVPWIGNHLEAIGQEMLRAIQNGMSKAFQGFMQWMDENVLQKIPEGIRSLLGLAHDTGVLARVGERMIEEMEIGVKNRFPSLQALMQGLFKADNVSGNLAEWIGAAIAYTGVDPSWASGLGIIVGGEDASLDPRNANLWDVNAKNGNPSVGLMQLTGTNRRAYTPSGMDEYNPIAEIIAGIRYIQATYGDVNRVPGVRSVRGGGAYLPYDEGGFLPPGVSQVVNLTGKPEPVFTSTQWDVLKSGGGRGGPVYVTVQIGDREIHDMHVEMHTLADRRGRLSS